MMILAVCAAFSAFCYLLLAGAAKRNEEYDKASERWLAEREDRQE